MSHPPAVLVHLCPTDEWSSAKTRGELRPESLTSVGFVHLSTPEQVHLPANRLYRGREDLVLLHIDPGPSGLTHSLGTRSSNGSGFDAVPALVWRTAGCAL